MFNSSSNVQKKFNFFESHQKNLRVIFRKIFESYQKKGSILRVMFKKKRVEFFGSFFLKKYFESSFCKKKSSILWVVCKTKVQFLSFFFLKKFFYSLSHIEKRFNSLGHNEKVLFFEFFFWKRFNSLGHKKKIWFDFEEDSHQRDARHSSLIDDRRAA